MTEPMEHRREYHRQMDALKADLLRLGGMVIETIPRGTEVLLTGDLKVAKELIDYDYQIDRAQRRHRGPDVPDHGSTGAGGRRASSPGHHLQARRRAGALGLI